jgi:hypothetical protein
VTRSKSIAPTLTVRFMVLSPRSVPFTINLGWLGHLYFDATCSIQPSQAT